MRNVARLQKPKTLSQNATRWKRKLIKKINECGKINKKVPSAYYDNYHQDDVLDTLKRMYKGLCCYCESRIEPVSFPNIEHLKPKTIFPKYTFDWDNLHLACGKCNTYKGNKYDNKHPILDPVKDNPISNHLYYECYYVMPRPDSKRGQTTIDHTQLNRNDLFDIRQKIFFYAWEVIEKIRNNPSDAGNPERIKRLKEMCTGEHGSLIENMMKVCSIP